MKAQAASNLPLHVERLGFQSNPFPMAPNGCFYFLTKAMEAHLTEILHCIDSRKGFILVSGEVGIGKTTLSRRLLRELESQPVDTALVFNTFLQSADLIAAINRDFGVDVDGGMAAQLAALNTFLIKQYAKGRNSLILIDDAQNLSIESLELIRQISNLETEREKLVQILLIAQPEILLTLARPEIRQLNSRLALRVAMQPWSREEVGRYVQFCQARAGNSERVRLSAGALGILHRSTRGYPRQVNMTMDRCLYAAAAGDLRYLPKRLMRRAAREIMQTRVAPIRYGKVFRASVAAALVLTAALTLTLRAGAWTPAGLPKPEPGPTLAASSERSWSQLAPVREDPRLVQARAFLADAKLQHLAAAFLDALDADDLAQFEQHLAAQGNGLQLVAKRSAATSDNANWPVFKSTANNRLLWIYLWRPRPAITDFHFGYRSVEIALLQDTLRQWGHYRGEVDGVVGAQTMTALARFQARKGLPPTGLPDTATLFELQTLAANGATPGPTSMPVAEVQTANTTRLAAGDSHGINDADAKQ